MPCANIHVGNETSFNAVRNPRITTNVGGNDLQSAPHAKYDFREIGGVYAAQAGTGAFSQIGGNLRR